jgi:hypothetical protein
MKVTSKGEFDFPYLVDERRQKSTGLATGSSGRVGGALLESAQLTLNQQSIFARSCPVGHSHGTVQVLEI